MSRSTRSPWLGLTHGALAAAVLLSSVAGAQDPKIPRWRLDPYTQNDPELLAELGYVRYAPFPFGQRGRDIPSTDDIDAHLSSSQILWVETAHFKIGVGLAPYRIPGDPGTLKKIRGELTRLQETLRRVKPKTRVLDPWLRLHLTAMRLEDTYAEFSELLGVADPDFPKGREHVLIGQGRFMGYGPYFGMPGKYTVLVTAKTGPYLDYLETFLGRVSSSGQRWHFKETGSLFYGAAADGEDAKLRHDTALHTHLVFNVAHNLVDGFRHYSYDLPVWIREGIAHWFARRISPRWPNYSQSEGGVADKRSTWRWRVTARRLMSSGKGAPLSEAYQWRDFSDIAFQDHVLIWSRWDYLMTLGNDKFAEFMFALKGRVDAKTWSSDDNDLPGATRDALRQVYGVSPLSFDERWREWVQENYPAQ
ncbi:MAG: hypothetical protein AAF628_18885 [Planctomycetota bacterium]